MPLRDILMMVLSTCEDEPVIAAGSALQARHGSALSSLLLTSAMKEISEWTADVDDAFWAHPLAEITRRAPESVRLKRRLESLRATTPIKQIGAVDGAVPTLASLEARRASLSILLRPAGATEETLRRTVFESVLFDSGRPVLLMPPDWRGRALGRNILIAWDGSRAAARALADAHELLAEADYVSVFSVAWDAWCQPSSADVAAHLRRTGLRCQQWTVRGDRHEIADLILHQSEIIGADLVVMGGYSHSRLREMLFGGVTRELVRAAPLPLLLSR